MAERAGVSPATVSRVLNDSATVSEARRALVLEAIEELGYRPNRIAANFRRRQAEMIGVVVSDIENPHFTLMVRAVEDAAYARGFRLLLCNTDEDPSKQSDYLGVLDAERVAGVILVPTDRRAPEISELLDHGIPVVAFDRRVADRRADAVLVRNAAGARLGTEHLIECGHERIGFVGGTPGLQTAEERRAGYREAVAAAGLPELTGAANFRPEGSRIVAGELLDAGATALLAASGLTAIGALRAIHERGLEIPRQVALVAIDDPPWALLTNPPLTTLAQPVREMGRAAVELLLSRLGRDGPPRRIRRTFDLELRHRGSCCNTALSEMENILTSHPDLKGVFAANEPGVIGVVHALLERNLVSKVKVVGFDNAPDEVSALRQGQVQALIVQNPYRIGYLGVQEVLELIQHKPVPHFVDTGSTVVTKANMNQPQIHKILVPPTIGS